MTREKLTLSDITGQESGIVVYPDTGGDKIIVCNWSSVCPDGGMPVLSPFGVLMCWPIDEIIEVVNNEHIDDIRTALSGEVKSYGKDDENREEIGIEGMGVVSDQHFDIPALWGYDCGDAIVERDDAGNLVATAGKIYKIKTASSDNAIVIAPDGWC